MTPQFLENRMQTPRNNAQHPRSTPRREWTKPTLRVHGDLATLTRAKSPTPADSAFGTQVS